MPDLVAIDLPGGPTFVDELVRAWEAGDAVVPIDQRLPHTAKQALLDAVSPSRLVDNDGSTRLEGSRPVEEGDALVVATSGSSGSPKGVILTHRAIEASARASSAALNVGRDDRWLACLPVAHIGGLSVVTRALVTGTSLTVIPKFDAAHVSDLARECTLVSLVATTLARIDASIFRTILLGGSSAPTHLPPNVVATYGMTETASGIVYDGVPLEGVEIRIADDGEILVRAPMVMRAYRDGSTTVDAQGWLHTDDAGRWLADGRLHVTGRRGDVIITGGQKVWPQSVEDALSSSLGHTDYCVVGVPDEEWGERVVLVTTHDAIDLGRVRDVVSSVLPSYCAPREIRRVDSIPRTAIGKVRRQSLRAFLSP